MDKKMNDAFNKIKTDKETLNKALIELSFKEVFVDNDVESDFDNYSQFIKGILDSIPGGIVIYEINDEIKPLYMNEAVLYMFGYNSYENECIENIAPLNEDLEKVKRDISEALKNNSTIESTFRVRKKDESICHILFKAVQIGKSDIFPVILSIMIDITKEINNENNLKYRIAYDSVTGIYNKDEFYKRTYDILLNNPDKEYDIISLDVDRFKLINDLFGMDEGDKLLRYIANMLKKELDFTYESCGRLYADNFAICKLRESGYEDEMIELSKHYLELYSLDINISVCFGIYKVEKNNDISVVSMCDRANMALKNIKGNYKKRYAFYEEIHRNVLLEEQQIINDMYEALEKGQFEVYFQPKYYLSNMKLIGAEALVRWIHPKKGMISPDKFIPVFEKSGFITIMDEYVWEFTCKKMREWLNSNISVVPISVNVSRVDIYNPKLCDNLKGLLNKYDIPINLLELEITETAYTENPSQLIEAVHELKRIGFTVEMDDFGTGYSSLNMLNQVPVDVLKLDLRFLKPTKVYGRGANILNSVVSMAKWLNLPVVAEGIETREQVAFLKSIGCSKGQGFYFAKPMPNKDFEELLRNSDKFFASNDDSAMLYIDFDELWNPNSQINILFDSFVGGLGVFELKGNNFYILRVNDRFYEIMNMDRDDVYAISPRLKEYIVKEDKASFFRKLDKAKKVNGEVIIETRLINPNTNEIMYILFRMRVILNNSERTLFLGSVDNFTNQKLTQNKLKSSEERYENIMDLTEDIVFEYDMKTMKIQHSNNLKSKFGKIPAKSSWLQSVIESGILQEKDIKKFSDLIDKIKKGQEKSINGKFCVKNIKNEYIWCVISAKGIYDKKNILTKIVGIISDIDATQRRLSIDSRIE